MKAAEVSTEVKVKIALQYIKRQFQPKSLQIKCNPLEMLWRRPTHSEGLSKRNTIFVTVLEFWPLRTLVKEASDNIEVMKRTASCAGTYQH